MTLVAVSASYGAAGGVVAPAVAKELDVPFVDRAIPFAVAQRLSLTVEEAFEEEERAPGLLERLLSGFIGQDVGTPIPPPARLTTPEEFRTATEEVLRRQAVSGRGVILGRAAQVVLRDDPRVLRVRLDGPKGARVRQAMRLGGVDEATAERTLRHTDSAHAAYLRRFYGADPHDPVLYHVVLDSTAIAPDACVEVIVTSARSFAALRSG